MRIQKRKNNRNNRKRILPMGLLGVMIFSFGGRAMATNYNDEYKIPASTYRDDNLEIDPVQGGSVPRQRSALESSYVSPYVTSIKNQNPYGTCWAFAAMAASEASMVKEGFAALEDLDLSEWHLAYFTANSVTDPLGGTEGDSYILNDEDYLNAGGNQQIATYRLANWYGVVDEKKAPYTTVSKYSSTEIEDALAESLPDSAAYSEDIAHLENAYWISMKDTQSVKQLIKQYGACGASYYSADAYYSTGTQDTWNASEEVAVYCPTAAAEGYVSTNHAITIVGWDDDYAKENFNSDAQPASDGAWYCKNSWGMNWSKDGYFWISYEDVRLLDENAFFFDYGTCDNYDNNYQYDGGAWGYYFQGYDSMANIYTAQQAEYLKAVGFYTDNSNYNCTIYIYKNVDSDDPYSGTLVLEQTANQLYAGFHTVELKEPIEVKKGESYSVVVYQTADDGSATRITLDSEVTSGGWYTNTVSAEAGQSFIGYHGKYMFDAGKEYDANCRIKAYTDNKVFVDSIELNDSQISLYSGNTATLTATVAPENADDKTVSWESSNENVVEVDENGVITAVGIGTASITCVAKDGSGAKARCDVTVKKQVTSVTLDYETINLLEDETLQLTATVLPVDATDKSVTWKSFDKEVATVDENGTVTATGYGKTYIECASVDQNQLYVVCEVVVCKPITSIELNENSAIIYVDDTLQLNANVAPDNDRTKGVSWVSSDEKVAEVDEEGLVTPIGAGEVTIRCIAKDGTGVEAACSVTVKQWVSSVSLNYHDKSMMQGDKVQLVATLLPTTASDKSIVWKSSDESVATVSKGGVVEAIGYGEATITCTATDRNQCVATFKVTVYELIKAIALNHNVATIDIGDTLQLNATVIPNLSNTKGVYWTTSDCSIATVDDKGVVTAISAGQATIQCIARDGSGIKESCSITVKEKIEILDKGVVFVDSEAGVKYTVTQSGTTGATVQFTDGKSCSGTVTIPDTVTAKGVTYKVTSVGAGAFAGNKALTKVVMRNNITSIGKDAFSGCAKLVTVTLGNNITMIGDKAFYKCSKLSKIVIPAKVNKIGKQAFYKCSKLKNITIKTTKLTKKRVGKKAFYGIHSKAAIKVPKKKLVSYKSILKSRGIGNKVKVKKY